ncbi:PHD finger protein 7 isoform X4 [Monodelphis domestica]|uniref:PHD finger protein 7 isoform X4 n=1 Tax=Monodelphis domestica TaxID=13616 RepID=UPI0024E2710D|nr:PHD finger protein 7 isoform X4 [Monodelphis domestica]
MCWKRDSRLERGAVVNENCEQKGEDRRTEKSRYVLVDSTNAAVFRACFLKDLSHDAAVTVCRMCLQEPGDPEKLGEFLQRDNLRIHYFCLILSSGLPQRGRASDGFHGFLPEDIKKETSRAARKTCFVCKKKGAAIFCQKERCRRNFHLPCGRERGCISQFFGEYKSFCEKHRPTQDIQPEKRAEDDCILCCESLSGGNDDNIQSPCCSRMIYHRKCIQKYAHSSAKHFFKCPQCNNREEFPKEMLRMGIHIPDRFTHYCASNVMCSCQTGLLAVPYSESSISCLHVFALALIWNIPSPFSPLPLRISIQNSIGVLFLIRDLSSTHPKMTLYLEHNLYLFMYVLSSQVECKLLEGKEYVHSCLCFFSA